MIKSASPHPYLLKMWATFKERGLSREKDNPHNVNMYVCDKGHGTVTFDQDKGVTPMFLPCFHEGCKLNSRSAMYTVPDAESLYEEAFKTAKRWIRPPLNKVPDRDFDHVLNGGLLLAHADGSLVWPGPPRAGNGARQMIRKGKVAKGETFSARLRRNMAEKAKKNPK